MKRVWQLIDREMRAEGLSGKQMAQRLQVDPAHLSRLRTGQLHDLSPDVLGCILVGIGKSPELHTELLAAYLQDKLEGSPHLQLASAQEAVADFRVAEPVEPYGKDASHFVAEVCAKAGLIPRVAEAFGTLVAKAPDDRRLQALIVSLADYTSEE